MNGINRVTLIGHLGRPPDIRYTADGKPVTTLSVATSEKWRDKDGDQKEHTEWHRVVMFNGLANIANEYLQKGAAVYLEGKLRTRKWKESDGRDRYSTEIIADEMRMLGGSNGASSGHKPSGHQAVKSEKNAASDQFQRPSSSSGALADDIPFAPIANL